MRGSEKRQKRRKEREKITEKKQTQNKKFFSFFSVFLKFQILIFFSQKERCIVFKLTAPQPKQLLSRLVTISKGENIKIDTRTLQALAEVSNCDIRSTVNTLQVRRKREQLEKEKEEEQLENETRGTLSKERKRSERTT